MQTTQCPSRDDLERLATGLIGDEAAAPIERHLLECPACVERMRALESDDTLLNALKAQSTVKERPAEANEMLRQLAARLGDLSQVTLSTQLDLTGEQHAKQGVLPLPLGEGRGEGGLNQSAARDAEGRPIAANTYAFLAPAQLPDEIGRLGGYRVLRVLGAGGMGVVFEAEDPRLKRHVALKVMKPDMAANAQSRQRFLREAQAMAALDHDHVVTVYQVGEDAGVPFLAMPFLRGESLDARLKRAASVGNALSRRAGIPGAEDAALLPLPLGEGRGEGGLNESAADDRAYSSPHAPREGNHHAERDAYYGAIENPKSALPLDEVLRIGREIADGLAAAHERGLIHRDVKPGNIWLETSRGRPRVKILDFGLARVSQGAEELTQSAAVLGTPSYMAPEQARSQPVDARADLFSLGCVLYRMVTGRPPFPGNDPLSVLMSLAISTPPAPRELNAEIPPELDDLIVSLLSKDPAGRPASAREVADRLERIEGSGFRVQGSGDALAALLPLPPGEGRGEGGLRALGLEFVDQAGQLTLLPNDGGEIANCELQIANCKLEDDNDNESNPKSKIENPKSPPPPRHRGPVMLASAAAAAALLAGILITIKNEKDETIAQLESDKPVVIDNVAPGTKAIIEEKADGKTQNTEDPTPKTQDLSPKTSPAGWHGWPADAPAPAIAPFDAAQAKKHQQEWADYLKLPVEYTNSIGMKFVLIPPGEFMMGSTHDETEKYLKQSPPGRSYAKDWLRWIQSEAPQHRVALTQPIYLGANEVTQKEYQAVVGKNPSMYAKTGAEAPKVAGLDTENHPVESVSWYDAAEFCARLSQQENLKPFYFRAGETVTPLSGTGYRLPTEAEWEFACRAGTTTRFFVGDRVEALPAASWCIANSGSCTHRVGELLSNPFSLFDVHGNASEWVQDAWEPTRYEQFAQDLVIDPICLLSGNSERVVFASPDRVVRGGRLDFFESDCRSSTRYTYRPNTRSSLVGFRAVLAVDALRSESLAAKPNGAPAGTPTSNLTSPSPAGDDPNSELFDWVNEVGGWHKFFIKNEVRIVKRWSEIRDLLPDGPYDVNSGTWWSIYLEGCQNVTDADCKRFKSVTKPLGLLLTDRRITDAGLLELQGLPTLLGLHLVETTVTGAGIKGLGILPNLDSMSLNGTSITDADLTLLSRFPKLAHITVGASHFTTRGIEALLMLPKLKDVTVIGDVKPEGLERLGSLGQTRPLGPFRLSIIGQFSGECLDRLGDLAQFTSLALQDSGLTDDGIAKLRVALPQLGRLSIGNSPVTDNGLRHLYASKLGNLTLAGTNVTAAGVAELQAALPKCAINWSPTLPPPSGDPNRDAAEWVLAMGGKVAVAPKGGSDTIGDIESASKLPEAPYRLVGVLLRGPFIRDDDLARLSNVAALETIQIADAKITGAALAHLRGLANLRSVDFNISPVGDEGIAWLKELPKLESLTLASAGVTNAGLEQVGALRRLGSLRLDYNPGVTHEGLAQLLPLHALRHLNLAGTAISDAGAEQLRELKQLTELSVGSTRITDDGLASLASLKRLKRLEIYDNVITDAGMPELAKLTDLERLIMTRTRVGDEGVEKLKELTKLQELNLERTELTDDGLKHLHAVKSLKHLDVTSTQVTAAGVAELQAALPNCQVIHDPAAAGR